MQNKVISVKISTEYITLGQLLKYKGIISMGNEAKYFLANNNILVNNELENRRGKKLYHNDEITINDVIYKII